MFVYHIGTLLSERDTVESNFIVYDFSRDIHFVILIGIIKVRISFL